MPWVKIDDHLPEHPKALSAGPQACWLYVAGLCYSARYLTDGFIPATALVGLGQYGRAQARRLAGTLIGVGLWEECNGGYRVHDYLKFQPSKQEVEERRSKKQAAGQAGGQASARLRGKGLVR